MRSSRRGRSQMSSSLQSFCFIFLIVLDAAIYSSILTTINRRMTFYIATGGLAITLYWAGFYRLYALKISLGNANILVYK